MTGFPPGNRQQGPQRDVGRKTSLSASDALRRHRVMAPAQCRDNRAKLANLRALIAGAEREYRMMTAELNRLDDEGRVWLVIDLIHKTALAALDLGAAIMQAGGMKSGDAARRLADATQSFSDIYGGTMEAANGGVQGTAYARTLAQRMLTHAPVRSAASAYAKGTADLALGGWAGIDAVSAAQGTSARNARAAEAGVETMASLIQRNADMLDAGTPGGHAKAKRVGAVAQIAKAMASYNRELEGAFERRLDISSSLGASRATFQARMQRTMARYRRNAADLETLLAGCV